MILQAASTRLTHEGDGTRDLQVPRQLFDAQKAAFARTTRSYAQRLDALVRLEASLRARRHDLAAAVAADFGGRAAEETLALELFPLLNEIRYARRHLKRWMAPQRAPVQWQFRPATARILHQPLGVVGILSPWNCPFFLTLAPLISVLAAGNHALLKPSELAPASAELIAGLIRSLFPPDYVTTILGGPDAAAAV